jgi:hypothetical protein
VKAAGARWWHEAGRAAARHLRDTGLAAAPVHMEEAGAWRNRVSWLVGAQWRGSGEERESETLV